MVRISRAAEEHRLRPVADQRYLAALSERMADALGLGRAWRMASRAERVGSHGV